MAEIGTVVLGRVGVEVYKAFGPKALLWAKSKVFGRSILFVGPSRAGKTSLLTFIRTGTYANPEVNAYRTLTAKPSPPLQFTTRNGQLRIDVKSIVDTRGTDTPDQHALLVEKYQPHALVIMIDASTSWETPEGSDAWLTGFFQKLAELRASTPRSTRRLRSLCLFINKVDLFTGDQRAAALQQTRARAQNLCAGTLRRLGEIINVLPLSMLEGHDGGTMPIKAVEAIFDPFVRD